jgi:hypothetical protein
MPYRLNFRSRFFLFFEPFPKLKDLGKPANRIKRGSVWMQLKERLATERCQTSARR